MICDSVTHLRGTIDIQAHLLPIVGASDVVVCAPRRQRRITDAHCLGLLRVEGESAIELFHTPK